MYEKILDENNLKDQPQCIFSLDEVNFCTDPRITKVFVPLFCHATYLKTPISGEKNV